MAHIRKIHTDKRETEKRKHRDDEHEEGNGKEIRGFLKSMVVLQHPILLWKRFLTMERATTCRKPIR